MQTFFITNDNSYTAKLLDYRRLGKQRVEAIQLLDVLLRKAGLLNDGKKGWSEHVAVYNWYSEEGNWLPSLIDYTQAMIDTWIARGYKNTINLDKYRDYVKNNPTLFRYDNPPWMQKEAEVLISHRARLLQKDTPYYMEVFLNNNIPIPENWESMEYVWMKELKTKKKIKN